VNPLVAGFILAGGRSSRMGQEKALLDLNGETLLARGLRQLCEVCAEVAIAGATPALGRFGRVIPDEQPGQGPLSGIIAALASSRFEWNLFCPVDVPFVPRSAWERLISATATATATATGREGDGSADAVLARVCGQVQPLCGLYHRRLHKALRKQFDKGQRKVTRAAEDSGKVVWVDFDQPAEGPWFRNVNTPEEYAQLTHPTV
jgi:molybdopterin-guanine dinucleotide biosynthesis protein A